jgi:hypothetical protein
VHGDGVSVQPAAVSLLVGLLRQFIRFDSLLVAQNIALESRSFDTDCH